MTKMEARKITYDECPVKCVKREADCDEMAIGRCKENLEMQKKVQGLKRYMINYIDGHDLKFKTFVIDAAGKDDALAKLQKEYEPYGSFDHQIESIREVQYA